MRSWTLSMSGTEVVSLCRLLRPAALQSGADAISLSQSSSSLTTVLYACTLATQWMAMKLTLTVLPS